MKGVMAVIKQINAVCWVKKMQ